MNKPWLFFDDFNEVLHLSKKWGSRAKSDKQINDLCEALVVCELCDLGYVGSPFT